MKKFLLGLAVYLGLLAPTLAQSTFQGTTQFSIQVAGTVAASTKIVSAVTGKRIYVTMVMLVPVATSVVTFTYGTGTNCGTGTQSVTGAMTFAAGQVLVSGDGTAPIFVLPPGNDLCITIATAVAPGALAYAQF